MAFSKRKFPGQDEHIEHLFSNNEHFHDLCLDYLGCVESLERFIADIAEQKAWIEEYGSLRNDL